MPRPVESHLLAQRVADPAQARLHLSGPVLLEQQRSGDRPWRGSTTVCADADAARLLRDRTLTALHRTGHHVLTVQRFTVPAAAWHACLRDPHALDPAFADAWAQTWGPALAALRAAHDADGSGSTHAVLLQRWGRHTAEHPWGAPLAAVLGDRPHGEHESGLFLAGVGPALLDWLRTYYAPALEPAPAALPAHPQDTGQTYAFAMRLWQPQLAGPLAALEQALSTARDLTDAGVPLPATDEPGPATGPR